VRRATLEFLIAGATTVGVAPFYDPLVAGKSTRIAEYLTPTT
jgi:hypothetical protein